MADPKLLGGRVARHPTAAREDLRDRRLIVRVKEVQGLATDQFQRRVAEHPLDGRAGEQHRPVTIQEHDDVGCVLDQRPEAPLAPLALLFQAPPRTQVMGHRHIRGTPLEGHGGPLHLDGNRRGAPLIKLLAHAGAAGRCPHLSRHQGHDVVVEGHALRAARGALPRGRGSPAPRHPVPPRRRLIDGDNGKVARIQDPHRVGAALEQLAVLLFGLLDRRFDLLLLRRVHGQPAQRLAARGVPHREPDSPPARCHAVPPTPHRHRPDCHEHRPAAEQKHRSPVRAKFAQSGKSDQAARKRREPEDIRGNWGPAGGPDREQIDDCRNRREGKPEVEHERRSGRTDQPSQQDHAGSRLPLSHDRGLVLRVTR